MRPYYQDDLVTIYHGDSREVVPQVDSLDVSMLLTDPPYGLSVVQSDGSVNGASTTIRHRPVVGDDQPFDPRPWLIYPKVILWGANHFAHHLPASTGWLVWDKREQTPSNWMSDAEMAWCSFKTPVRIFRHYWNGPVRASERGNHIHPTQKPVALMRWTLEQFTQPGDLILDPFMGSGPIAQACSELGRRYIGVELDEAYCAAAVARLAQGTLDFGGVA